MAYKEIANDNWEFMTNYDSLSLFNKIPTAYSKLSHNYGAVDFKDLDPKNGNIFSKITAKPPKKQARRNI